MQHVKMADTKGNMRASLHKLGNTGGINQRGRQSRWREKNRKCAEKHEE